MGRPVVHFEIGCRDKTATAKFYEQLFDWTTEEMGPAAMIATGAESGIQGHITALGHEPHNYTIFYVGVENVEEALKKAESLGGKTLIPPVPIPTGTFAWMSDPEGNTVGLFEVKK
jgi:predicted enzyme related to lactoylglutathione lyase